MPTTILFANKIQTILVIVNVYKQTQFNTKEIIRRNFLLNQLINDAEINEPY